MRIVILAGKEPFLVGEATRRLVELLEGEFGGVDQFHFDGETAQPADVLDELRSYALLKPHKLVIVDDADRFLAGPKKSSSDSEGAQDNRRRRALEAYAERPTPDATLLLRSESWRQGRLDRLVARVGAKIKCDPLKNHEAVRWCINECEPRHGIKIERAAAALLVERLGTGLARLSGELAKLVAFVGGSRSIGPRDVIELVGCSREEKAWALQSAILTGRPEAALAKQRELLEISQLPGELVMWAISDLLRRLHTAARLLGAGTSVHAVESELRLFGDTGKGIIELARRSDPARFAQLLQLALDTDRRTKSGWGKADRNLEALTLRVTDTIGCC